jgi:hypothetical protein
MPTSAFPHSALAPKEFGLSAHWFWAGNRELSLACTKCFATNTLQKVKVVVVAVVVAVVVVRCQHLFSKVSLDLDEFVIFAHRFQAMNWEFLFACTSALQRSHFKGGWGLGLGLGLR